MMLSPRSRRCPRSGLQGDQLFDALAEERAAQECEGWPIVVVRTPDAGGGVQFPARDPAGEQALVHCVAGRAVLTRETISESEAWVRARRSIEYHKIARNKDTGMWAERRRQDTRVGPSWPLLVGHVTTARSNIHLRMMDDAPLCSHKQARSGATRRLQRGGGLCVTFAKRELPPGGDAVSNPNKLGSPFCMGLSLCRRARPCCERGRKPEDGDELFQPTSHWFSPEWCGVWGV